MKTVILDIDETLVYSRMKLENSLLFHYEGKEEFTLIRPSAEAFLKELKSRNYRVVSLTQGHLPWQEAVLTAGGIRHYFEGVYGRDNLYGYENGTYPDLTGCQWVLVDNLHYSNRDLEPKAIWIKQGGGGDLSASNSIKCESFHGTEFPGKTLMALFQEIEEKLGGTDGNRV